MTNREKYFLKRDEYDTMMTISRNIEGVGTFCAIKAVSGRRKPCMMKYMSKNGHMYRDCETCVQHWLNEEAK